MIAGFHAQAIKAMEDSSLVAIYARRQSTADELATEFGCKAYSDEDAFFNDPDIEIFPGGNHKALVQLARLQAQLSFAGQRLRRRHLNHVGLVVVPIGFRLKRQRTNQDGLTVLQRHHPPGTETPTVPGPLDFKFDILGRVTRTQKIGVLRVQYAPRINSCNSSAHALGQYLSAVDAKCLRVHVFGSEPVLSRGFGSKNIEQLVEHSYRFYPK